MGNRESQGEGRWAEGVRSSPKTNVQSLKEKQYGVRGARCGIWKSRMLNAEHRTQKVKIGYYKGGKDCLTQRLRVRSLSAIARRATEEERLQSGGNHGCYKGGEG